MNIHQIITAISDPLPSSEIQIRSLSNVDKIEEINSSVLWHTKAINKKYFKEIHFSDGTWYAENNKQTNIVTLDEDNEFSFQIKAYALIKLFNGNVEGGVGYKASSVAGHTLILNQLAKFLMKKNFTSFHHFSNSPQLIISNTLHEYLFQELKADQTLPKREFSTLFNVQNSFGLLSEVVCDMFHGHLAAIQDKFHKNRLSTLSHPVIPTNVLKVLIQRANKNVEQVKDKIEDWKNFNDQVLARLEERVEFINTVSNVSTLVRNAVNACDTEEDYEEKYVCFNDLKISVLVYILTFTGMRIDEALSCKIGCAFEKDGTYYVQSTMTKTDGSTIELDWVANEDTYNAVQVLEEFVINMRKRGECLKHYYPEKLKPENLHNLELGLKENKLFGVAHSMKSISFSEDGRFADFDNTDGTAHEMFNISLSELEIDQLEQLECNYKRLKGPDRGKPYSVGDQIRISAHMFRHTFAWFIIANRLGELDDIKYQFNHLSKSMTMVYGNRGIASVDEMLDIINHHEELLTKKVANEIAEESMKGNLGGGGGERFNKIAKDLVIGITSSESDEPDRINQIHFKDMEEYVLFLQKNLKGIRGLIHGYCSGGEACKIKNAGLPSGCVYCGSYTVVERQMVHWRAMRNGAAKKLEKLRNAPDEVKKRYELLAINWQDTFDAADHVIRNAERNKQNDKKEQTK